MLRTWTHCHSAVECHNCAWQWLQSPSDKHPRKYEQESTYEFLQLETDRLPDMAYFAKHSRLFTPQKSRPYFRHFSIMPPWKIWNNKQRNMARYRLEFLCLIFNSWGVENLNKSARVMCRFSTSQQHCYLRRSFPCSLPSFLYVSSIWKSLRLRSLTRQVIFFLLGKRVFNYGLIWVGWDREVLAVLCAV